MITDLNKILVEWAYRISDGKPDVSNKAKLLKLETVLYDFGWSREARAELLNTLIREDDVVKNKKTGNVYTVKNHNPETQDLVKKNASKDDIKKIDKAKEKGGEEKPKEKAKAQSNGYVGEKDKTVEKGDPSTTEEYQREPEPDDEEFEKRNEKHKNPEPPSPLDLSNIIKNPKFPKRYIKMLERMANSRLNATTKKWEHFSDIAGGAGQIKAQSGELMTMIGSSLDDEEFEELMNALEEHEKQLVENHPEVFKKKNKQGRLIDNPGSRIVDKSWIQSARNNRKAILDRLQKQYGEGTKIIGAAWDAKDEVEAMGLSDYENNKGFSTDCYFKIEKPNGEQVIDEVSLKKSTKVNFLNSGAGDFENWDPDLPDEINQKVYRAKARKRNIDFIEQNRQKVDEFLNSPDGAKVKKLMKSKGIDLEKALEGNSRDKQNVLFQTIKLMSKTNEDAKKIVEQDNKEHNEFVEKSVKAITENEKMKNGMLNTIRSEFPLKAVSDGEETMAIGPNSLDKETMKAIFGTDDYDEIKEKLVAEPGPPPFIGYNVEATGEVFPVAEVKIREDGRGYGGQFKFEMVLHKAFAPRLENAQKEVYG